MPSIEQGRPDTLILTFSLKEKGLSLAPGEFSLREKGSRLFLLLPRGEELKMRARDRVRERAGVREIQPSLHGDHEMDSTEVAAQDKEICGSGDRSRTRNAESSWSADLGMRRIAENILRLASYGEIQSLNL